MAEYYEIVAAWMARHLAVVAAMVAVAALRARNAAAAQRAAAKNR